jgi:hypothetical protein
MNSYRDIQPEPVNSGLSFTKAVLYLICILIIIVSYQFTVLQAMVTGTLIRQQEDAISQLNDELESVEAEINMSLYNRPMIDSLMQMKNLRITQPDQVVAYLEIVDDNAPTQTNFMILPKHKTLGEKLLNFTGTYKSDNQNQDDNE